VNKEPTLIVTVSSELIIELFSSFQLRIKNFGCLRKTDRAYLEERYKTDRQQDIGGWTVGSVSVKSCLPYILTHGLAVRLKYAILCPLWMKEMIQFLPQWCYLPVVDHKEFINMAIR
jgi:hypothetical protein